MSPPVFTPQVLRKILNDSFSGGQELLRAYSLIPPTRCRRQAHCCSLLPEITLLEGLQVIEWIRHWSRPEREALIKRAVRYFFLNPVEITTCPFLQDRNCLIYEDRFFGCRAYGLWSPDYYQNLTRKNRQGKMVFLQLWKNMGVGLPEKVVAFQVPYCLLLESELPHSDETLLKASEWIETISQQLHPWHGLFKETYFSDFSFLVTSLIFGLKESLRLKFSLVREILQTGNRDRLSRLLEETADPLATTLDH